VMKLPLWGESTLWWPLLGCHIVLLSRDVHVWMYPTSNLWKNFTIFLHIILEYNLGKKYICGNECNVPMYSKTQIYSKKNLNDF
jgi:hypothetical protein